MKAAIQISISSTRLSKFEHPSQQGVQYINLRLVFYEYHEVCLFVYFEWKLNFWSFFYVLVLRNRRKTAIGHKFQASS